MMALPKAISQGSNGAGGGALTALTAMSAARAEPESSASAVASKTIFFMTIPIVTDQSDFEGPKHSDRRLHVRGTICGAATLAGSEKDKQLPPFWAFWPCGWMLLP